MNLRKLDSLVSGSNQVSEMLPYRGHRHFAQRLLKRRGFLEKTGLSLGALVGSGLLTRAISGNAMPMSGQGRNGTTSAVPQPIPGGLQLLGPSGPLFHLFLPAPGVEPSTITDFNGFIGWAAVGGTGTHTPLNEPPANLVFESDVRFMLGEFVGADGQNHHGAFAFI